MARRRAADQPAETPPAGAVQTDKGGRPIVDDDTGRPVVPSTTPATSDDAPAGGDSGSQE